MLSPSPDLLQPTTTGLGNRTLFLRQLLESAGQQLQAKRDGGLLNIECQPGEGPRFERLAKERHLSLAALTRYLLLQECYRGKRQSTGGNDQALAEAVAQARGMRPCPHPAAVPALRRGVAPGPAAPGVE